MNPPSPSGKHCIIVLAAGAGRRFAGPEHKLESRLGERPVLAQTMHNALATGLRVVLVISAPLHRRMQGALPEHDAIVVDTLARSPWGMGDSIAAAVSRTDDADGWTVLPGDMPLVTSNTLVRVAASLALAPVAYARYEGRRGHPVAFRSELAPALRALTGDEGARSLLSSHESIAVDVDDPGVVLDIDTVDDLEAAVRLAGERFPP